MARTRKRRRKDPALTEYNKMIAQDNKLGKITQSYTTGYANQMANDAERFANLASQYQPAQGIVDSAVNDATRMRIEGDNALRDQIAQNQANSIAQEVLSSGKAGVSTLRSGAAAIPAQHHEYARWLRRQLPFYRQEQQAQQSDAALKSAQLELAIKKFGLDANQFNQMMNYRYDSLNSQNDRALLSQQGQNNRTAAGIRSRERTAAQKLMASLSKEQRTALQKLRRELFHWDKVQTATGSKRKWRHPKKQFRTTMELLMGNHGLNARNAALLAASWSAYSDQQAGKPITFRPGRKQGFYQAMRNRGVPAAYAIQLVRQFYGAPGWVPISPSQSTRFPLIG